MRRRQAEEQEKRENEILSELRAHEEALDEAETRLDSLRQVVGLQEVQRRMYAQQQSTLIKDLRAVLGPVTTAARRFQNLQERLQALHDRVRGYQMAHRLYRQQEIVVAGEEDEEEEEQDEATEAPQEEEVEGAVVTTAM